MTSFSDRPLWSEGSLADLGTLERGRSRHRPRNDPALFGGPYPFFQTGDIKGADLRVTAFQETYNETGLAQSRLWPAGTLCITIAANIADAAILGLNGCFPDSVVGFTPHPGKSDVVFVKYLLDHIKHRFENISRGTTQDNLSLEKLLSVRIRYPPLLLQRKIAAILSAFDDLIENDNRRIKLLGEMARRIYQEWFVDFRYPGHEAIPLAKSELGSIPEGWDVRSLTSLTETITRGVSPTYADNSNQLVINQRCIRDGRLDLALARGHSTAIAPAKMLRTGDVLINSTGVGTLGRVAQVLFSPAKLTVDSHVTIVRPAPKAAISDFLGLALLEREGDFAAMGVGSTGQTELGRTAIGELKIAVPPLHVQKDFANAVASLRRLPLALAFATAKLSATRDLLLPRLISGEIDVTDLNIAMPEAAA